MNERCGPFVPLIFPLFPLRFEEGPAYSLRNLLLFLPCWKVSLEVFKTLPFLFWTIPVIYHEYFVFQLRVCSISFTLPLPDPPTLFSEVFFYDKSASDPPAREKFQRPL